MTSKQHAILNEDDVFTLPSAATRQAALVSSDRRDSRADHTVRAGIPVQQKEHDKGSWG